MLFARLKPILLMLGCVLADNSANGEMNLIEQSRKSCVQVSSEAGSSRGTGFFIAADRIATCFHVISSLAIDGTNVKWTIYPDLKVKTDSGEIIEATCVSAPNRFGPEPLQFDFAILKLKTKPKNAPTIVNLRDPAAKHSVGDSVMFSGYPLATPAMVTHKGMISGEDPSGNIICIQGPINKGNSGGALLTEDGEAAGIISMREGGISQGLNQLSAQITETQKSGSITLMGVNPLDSIKAIIGTLDTYISTGIGYAVSTKHLKAYVEKHPEILK
jgi:S1-C subfamily serine protease